MDIFRKKIYPVDFNNTNFQYTNGDLNSIDLLKKNKLDLAFIDENTLLEYKSKSKYPINFSTICVCYRQNFIFITLSETPIYSFEDIINLKISINVNKKRNIRIGVLNKKSTDYQQLIKICYISGLNIIKDIDIVEFNSYLDLINEFKTKTIDVIYMLSLQKNPMIYNMTNYNKCRFITPKIDKKLISSINPNKIMNLFSYPPFIYLIKNKKKPSLEVVFNKKNIIIYHNSDRFELIKLLKICEPFFKITYDIFLNKYCKGFHKLLDLNKYLFNTYKNKYIQCFMFITQDNNKRESQLSKIRLLSQEYKIYSNVLYLHTNSMFVKNIEEEYFKIINEMKNRDTFYKNQFKNIFNSVIELNSYVNNINTNNFIETYSTRQILVCRNKIPQKSIKILLQNLLSERDNILSKYEYYLNNGNEYKNISIKEIEKMKLNLTLKSDINIFKVKEMASVKDLPYHPGALKFFEKTGLIKRYIEYKNNI